MEWIAINQDKKRRPIGHDQAQPRPRLKEREIGAHKLGEKKTLFLFLVDVIFPFMYLVIILNLVRLGFVYFPFISIL